MRKLIIFVIFFLQCKAEPQKRPYQGQTLNQNALSAVDSSLAVVGDPQAVVEPEEPTLDDAFPDFGGASVEASVDESSNVQVDVSGVGEDVASYDYTFTSSSGQTQTFTVCDSDTSIPACALVCASEGTGTCSLGVEACNTAGCSTGSYTANFQFSSNMSDPNSCEQSYLTLLEAKQSLIDEAILLKAKSQEFETNNPGMEGYQPIYDIGQQDPCDIVADFPSILDELSNLSTLSPAAIAGIVIGSLAVIGLGVVAGIAIAKVVKAKRKASLETNTIDMDPEGTQKALAELETPDVAKTSPQDKLRKAVKKAYLSRVLSESKGVSIERTVKRARKLIKEGKLQDAVDLLNANKIKGFANFLEEAEYKKLLGNLGDQATYSSFKETLTYDRARVKDLGAKEARLQNLKNKGRKHPNLEKNIRDIFASRKTNLLNRVKNMDINELKGLMADLNSGKISLDDFKLALRRPSIFGPNYGRMMADKISFGTDADTKKFIGSLSDKMFNAPTTKSVDVNTKARGFLSQGIEKGFSDAKVDSSAFSRVRTPGGKVMSSGVSDVNWAKIFSLVDDSSMKTLEDYSNYVAGIIEEVTGLLALISDENISILDAEIKKYQ